MNVIFIMNDSYRRDHLGCYGNPEVKTPNLDRFAQHAAVFDQFYVASYPTVPNRWDLTTGRYGFPFRGWQPLGPGDVTWAQLISGAGVHTEMIWDTPMLAVHNYDYTRGFAAWDFVHGQKGDPWITDPRIPIRLPAQPHKIRAIGSGATGGLIGYMRNHARRLYEREFCVGRTLSTAMDWLETNYSHKSFFLYIDMWDPHEPFDCPWYDYQLYADPDYQGEQMTYPEYGRNTYMSEAEKRNVRALYAGNCTLVDRWVGHFLDTCEKLGLFKNTVIIWTTDHGHLFGDHDLQGKPGAELGTLYEATTRIPLLVHHPEGLGAGKRIKGIVQPPDILPSILDALGINIPSHVQGKSFWPLVTGEKSKLHDYAFSSRFPPTAGDASYTPVEGAVFDGWVGSGRIVEPSTVTDDEWAYLCAVEGMPSELYNIKNDPRQKNNVIKDHPDVAKRMRNAWIEFLKEHGAPEARIKPFVEPIAEVHTPTGGKLWAFRDDMGQWIAFPTEREARALAYREDAPGPRRSIQEVTFGQLLDDNPKNLIHLFGQYYWAQDLA
mgnify:CR=1 FL=1